MCAVVEDENESRVGLGAENIDALIFHTRPTLNWALFFFIMYDPVARRKMSRALLRALPFSFLFHLVCWLNMHLSRLCSVIVWRYKVHTLIPRLILNLFKSSHHLSVFVALGRISY